MRADFADVYQYQLIMFYRPPYRNGRGSVVKSYHTLRALGRKLSSWSPTSSSRWSRRSLAAPSGRRGGPEALSVK
ncbi:hypothetical protein EVAR_24252_1 [Eumeta japonica]|uniref:Uncharacterized protein n=1 Tax=Eumeta variegata TaxID=151549 RepID=A0A4C1VE27_EUMVA|nr:hypothetical protein EVAR_24252_1 [Eumeta japonica]